MPSNFLDFTSLGIALSIKYKTQNMNISVELTLTPLQDDFEPPILNFIKGLRAS